MGSPAVRRASAGGANCKNRWAFASILWTKKRGTKNAWPADHPNLESYLQGQGRRSHSGCRAQAKDGLLEGSGKRPLGNDRTIGSR